MIFLQSLPEQDWWMAWVWIPLLVFIARAVDVAIGTMRLMLLSRNLKIAVGVLGFLETLLWIVTISQIFKHVNNWAAYLAWAGGFTVGNLIGMMIVDRMAVGMSVVRIISATPVEALCEALHHHNIGYTVVDGQGSKCPVKVVFVVVKKSELRTLQDTIRAHNPELFYSIEDITAASNGIFPMPSKNFLWAPLSVFGIRK